MFVNRGDNGDAQRQQRDHHRDPEAARRARQAARLPDARALAAREHDGQDARARDGADGGGVDAGGRPRARGSRRHAGDRRQGGRRRSRIEPWDYRYYAEKVRKAKYDLDENEVKPYLQLEKLREGDVLGGGRAVRLRASRRSTGDGAGVPSRRARLGGERQAERQARRPLVLRPLRARRASARARG